MPATAIMVRDMVKTFRRRGRPTVRAVDGISFDVMKGSIFGLLGPNGAGKTTLLRILTTLLRPSSGSAEVMGYDLARHPLDVRRSISVVVQENAADLLLTVRDNLRTYARFHGLYGKDVTRRIERVLDMFGLRAEAGRKVQDLSGGYRRRVQVAKTAMVDTPLVFLDEFSTGMDPILKRHVMEHLRVEARRGRTIVLTTHILSEAEQLCDQLLIIDRGREIARGDLNTLKLMARGVYRVVLTYERLPERIEEELAREMPLRVRVSQNTIEVALQQSEDRVLALVTRLATRGRVLRVEVSGASLEDVFIELTGRGRAEPSSSGPTTGPAPEPAP